MYIYTIGMEVGSYNVCFIPVGASHLKMVRKLKENFKRDTVVASSILEEYLFNEEVLNRILVFSLIRGIFTLKPNHPHNVKWCSYLTQPNAVFTL